MNAIETLKSSRTIKASIALDLLITVQMSFPELQELLGAWYGLGLLVINMVVKYYKITSATDGTER